MGISYKNKGFNIEKKEEKKKEPFEDAKSAVESTRNTPANKKSSSNNSSNKSSSKSSGKSSSVSSSASNDTKYDDDRSAEEILNGIRGIKKEAKKETTDAFANNVKKNSKGKIRELNIKKDVDEYETSKKTPVEFVKYKKSQTDDDYAYDMAREMVSRKYMTQGEFESVYRKKYAEENRKKAQREYGKPNKEISSFEYEVNNFKNVYGEKILPQLGIGVFKGKTKTSKELNEPYAEYYDRVIKEATDKADGKDIIAKNNETLKEIKDMQIIDKNGEKKSLGRLLGYDDGLHHDMHWMTAFDKQNKVVAQIEQAQNTDKDFQKYVELGMASDDDKITRVLNKYDIFEKSETGIYTDARYADNRAESISALGGGSNHIPSEELRYLNLNEKEKGIYYYLLGKFGKDEAEHYVENIGAELDKRRVLEEAKKYEEFGNDHKIAAYAASTALATVDFFSYADEVINQYNEMATGIENKDNAFTDLKAITQYKEAMREGIVRDMGAVGQAITEFSFSIGDNLANRIYGPAALVMMGLNKAGAVTQNKMEQGLSGEAALGFATVSGAIEIVAEKLPFEHLNKIFKSSMTKETARGIFKPIAKQMFIEAGEEAITNIADNLAEIWMLKNDSTYQRYIAYKIKNGASEEEAKREAFVKFFLSDTAMSALMGALLGGIMSGGATAVGGIYNIYNTYEAGKELRGKGLGATVVAEGYAQGLKTDAHKHAQKLWDKDIDTNYAIGKQARLNAEAYADLVARENAIAKSTGTVIKHQDLPEWMQGKTETKGEDAVKKKFIPNKDLSVNTLAEENVNNDTENKGDSERGDTFLRRVTLNSRLMHLIDTLDHEMGHIVEKLAPKESDAAIAKTIKILLKPQYRQQFENRIREVMAVYKEKGEPITRDKVMRDIAIDMRREGLLYKNTDKYIKIADGKKHFIPGAARSAAARVESLFGATHTNTNAGITISMADADAIRQAWLKADIIATVEYGKGNNAKTDGRAKAEYSVKTPKDKNDTYKSAFAYAMEKAGIDYREYLSNTDNEEAYVRKSSVIESVDYSMRYNDLSREQHRLYNKAKDGDNESAYELIDEIMKNNVPRIDKDVFILPVVGAEGTSTNEMPQVIAEYIAEKNGNTVFEGICKEKSSNSRSLSMLDRMKEAYPAFDISVYISYNDIKGKKFYLIDDNSTTGRTFIGLENFIIQHGGEVVGYYALTTGHDSSEKMIVTDNTWSELEKIGIENITEFAKKEGIQREISRTGLTEREGQQLRRAYIDDRRTNGTLQKSSRERQEIQGIYENEDSTGESRSGEKGERGEVDYSVATEGKKKVSKLYKNSMQKEMFNQEFKDLAEDRKDEFMYSGISNKVTYMNAKYEVTKKGAAQTLAELAMKDTKNWTAEDTAKSLAIMAEYQTAGDTEKAVDTARLLRERMTTMGQSVQALKLIDKLTPEGQLMDFVKSADDAVERQIKSKHKDVQRQIRKEIEEAKKKDKMRKPVIGLEDVPKKKGPAEPEDGKWYRESREGVGVNPKEILEKMPTVPPKMEKAEPQQKEQSFVDEVLDRYGIKHMKQADLDFANTMLNIIDSECKTKEDLIKVIIAQSKARNTPSHTIVRKALERQDVDFLKSTAVQQVFGMISDRIPESFAQKLSTYQAEAQLLNARTMLRNIISNTVFDVADTVSTDIAAITDCIIGLFSKQRTVGVDFGVFQKGNFENAKKRARDKYLDIALAVNHSGGNNKYELQGGKRVFKSKLFGGVERALSYGLSVTDEFAKGSIEQRTRASLLKLKKLGFNSDEVNEIIEETEKYRTFQDETTFARILHGLKNVLNVAGVGKTTHYLIAGKYLPVHEFGLGDIVQKYTIVPGNLISRSVEYSPLGYMKFLGNVIGASYHRAKGVKLSPQTQRKIALDFSRATTGTGLIALFYVLSKAGVMVTEDEDEDKRLRDMQRAEGISGTQLNLSALSRWIKTGDPGKLRDGDVLESIGFLEPLNTLMAMGAAICEAEGGAKSISNWADVVSAKTFDQVLEMSTMSTLRSVFDTISYGGGTNDVLIAVATNAVTGFIPALTRQAGNFADTSQRYPYQERNIFEKPKAQISAVIPFARESVAARVTPFGEEKKINTGNKVLDLFNQFINPGYGNVYQTTDISKELYRLAESDIAVLPDTPEKNFKFDGKKYELYGKEYERYSKILGKSIFGGYSELMASEKYKAMSDEEKIDALYDVKQEAKKAAKEMFINGNDVSLSMSFASKTNPLDKRQANIEETQKQQRIDSVITSIESVADAVAKAVPDKADDYTANALQINSVKSTTIDGKSYDIPDDIEKKIISEANVIYYDSIEKLLNNEVRVEDIVGLTAKGRIKTSTQADGVKVSLSGKLYNEDGSPRFDELVTARILWQAKDRAKESVIEKYIEEITGEKAPKKKTQAKASSSGKKKFVARRSGGTKKSRSTATSGRFEARGGAPVLARATPRTATSTRPVFTPSTARRGTFSRTVTLARANPFKSVGSFKPSTAGKRFVPRLKKLTFTV